MAEDFIVNAEERTEQGKGASRRLRRAGKVPAILYGGKGDPRMLQVDHAELLHHLDHEAFYSHILTVKVGDKTEQAILKDVQRHPYKVQINHVDLLRIVKGQKIRVNVPLHFMGEETAPGVKLEGGVVQHLMTDLEISVLPRNLPEYIEVDVSELNVDESIHLSDITLPEGCEISNQLREDDPTLVSIHIPRAAIELEELEAAEAEEAAAEAEEGEEGEEGKEAAAEGEEGAEGEGEESAESEEKKEKGGEE